jgi:DNA modification methylase
MNVIPKVNIERGECFILMAGLPDGEFDLVLTDPPYNTTNLHFECKINWKRWWREIERITKESAIICAFSAQPFTTDLINSNRKHFRYDLVWKKSTPVGFLDAKRRPLRAHEVILVFAKHGVGQCTYRPQMRKGKFHINRIPEKLAHYGGQTGIPGTVSYVGDEYYPTSVLEYANRIGGYSPHPTAKPVELLRWLVRTYSKEGEKVLDPFMGAGSTGEACLLEGRDFTGYELDEHYFDVTTKRLDEIKRLLKLEPKKLQSDLNVDGLPLFDSYHILGNK